MNIGYTKPLYLLPFDHRDSYVSGMFKFKPPLSADQYKRVVASKQLIYDGFLAALNNDALRSHAGILIDEEFGSGILHDAIKKGFASAVSVEKSGSDEFEFEYGNAFATHIAFFKPTFAKVLVRYNPEGDNMLNLRQIARLLRLSNYCRSSAQRLMFELLVPATPAQMDRFGDNKDAYDREYRPALMIEAICTLQDAGIEPSIWKIEGLDSREDCEKVVDAARRQGRSEVGCIVLGRGADEKKVAEWLTIAATVPGFIGFAVGRTTFWDAVAAFESNAINREEAVSRIAERYRLWVSTFEKAHFAQTENSPELIGATATRLNA
jgi:myo-inositol catabolism protein IolC